jgi:hypothetical protein
MKTAYSLIRFGLFIALSFAVMPSLVAQNLSTPTPDPIQEAYQRQVDESANSLLKSGISDSDEVPVDNFEYVNPSNPIGNFWKVINSSGNTTIEFDSSATPDKTSMHITTDLPCTISLENRSSLIARRFSQPYDLSQYRRLIVTLRTEINEQAKGGEFSVVLWESSLEKNAIGQEEVWQSTGWLYAGKDFSTLSIALTGDTNAKTNRDPWSHPGDWGRLGDFIIPPWEQIGDGKLDPSRIIAIGIRSNTTNEYCDVALKAETWIDSIMVAK